MKGSPAVALSYFISGAKIIIKPGYRRFVFVPLCINFLIFILLTIGFYFYFKEVIDQVLDWFPSWLNWLIWLMWPILLFLFLVVYGYCFNLITNFIAAPFFGILAGRVERELTGIEPPDEPWKQLIPRTLIRELIKLFYFITRGLLVVLLIVVCFFIPGANIISLVVAAIWSCWCMAAQYSDYPADNHQFSFRELRRKLNQEPLTSYSFGGLIMLGSMIPFLNIFVTPIGVAGATVFWVKELNPPKVVQSNEQ